MKLPPPCGTNMTYAGYHCRCDPCRAARLAYVQSLPSYAARTANQREKRRQREAEGTIRKPASKSHLPEMEAHRKAISAAKKRDALKWETRFARLVDPDYYRGIRQPLQQSTLSEFA